MNATEQSSERRALVSTIGWSALATLTTIGARFAAGVIVARLLGPEHTGRLMYLLWIVDFTAVVVMLALPHVVTRFWAELEGQDRPLAAAAVNHWLYRWCLGLAAGGGAVTAYLAGLTTAGPDARFIAACLGGYFFTLALHTYYLAYLAGRQQFRLSARLSVVSSIALVAGVTIGVPAWGIAGAAAGYLASTIPGAVLSLSGLRRVSAHDAVETPLRLRLMRYAGFTWIGAVVSAVTWSRGEIFFLERYGGEFWVAMFAIGVSLSALATQGPMLLTGAMLPHFAQLAGAGRLDTLRSRYATGTRVLSLLLFPLCLGLSSLIPVLLPFVYGRDFTASVPAAMALVAFSFLAFTNVAADVIYALERAWFLAAVGGLGAVAAVLAGFLIIPSAGIWGAVWSRIAIQTASVAAAAIYLWRYHGFPFPARDLAGIALASLICAACSAGIVRAFDHIAAVFVAIPVAALAYAILIRALGIIKPSDAALFTEVIDRLPAAVAPVARSLLHGLTHTVRHQPAHDI
jgi:O-antigen/teichoic acid export membrane protein